MTETDPLNYFYIDYVLTIAKMRKLPRRRQTSSLGHDDMQGHAKSHLTQIVYTVHVFFTGAHAQLYKIIKKRNSGSTESICVK